MSQPAAPRAATQDGHGDHRRTRPSPQTSPPARSTTAGSADSATASRRSLANGQSGSLLDVPPQQLTSHSAGQENAEVAELRKKLEKLEKKYDSKKRELEELRASVGKPAPGGPAAAGRPGGAEAGDAEEAAKRKDVDVTKVLKMQRMKSDQWEKTFGPKIFKGVWGDGTWKGGVTDNQKESCVKQLLETFQMAVKEMNERLVERDEASRLLLLSVVAKANILLFGPPGTAKSAVCRLLAMFIYDTAPPAEKEGDPEGGNSYFEAQFHQSTTVEDIFGAMSLTHLQKGRLKRNVESMLPYASVAFLDEAFKAQASLLSCLLSTLNERCFKNGDQMLVNLPLWTTVVASNEVPLEAGAGALFDRLLLRTFVGYVTAQSQASILNSAFKSSSAISPKFSLEDIAALNKWAKEKLRYTAPKDPKEAAKGKWKRRLKHLFLLEDADMAKKLLERLSADGGGVKVSAAIMPPAGKLEKSDFLYQKLDQGLTLDEGWSKSGGGEVYNNLSTFQAKIEDKSAYPKVLGFSGGLEEVGAYGLIEEFLDHVRAADELEQKIQSNKRQSVEGGGRLSDRRYKQIGDLLRLVASSNFDVRGQPRTWIIVPDLFIMVYCCWKTKKDWDELSRWWMERLKQELRSMDKQDVKGHDPKNPPHMWLPSLVVEDLARAFRESGITEDTAMAYCAITRTKCKAKEEERDAALEQDKQEQQERQARLDAEMRFQADLEDRAKEEEYQALRRRNEAAARAEANQQRINDEKLKEAKEREARIRKQNENLKKMEAAEKAMEKLREKEEEAARALQQRKLQEQKVQEQALQRNAEKLEHTKEVNTLMDQEDNDENVKKLKTLLEKNADVNSGCRGAGDSPFTWAVYKGRTNFVKAMIMASPDPKTSYVDSNGDPPLCQVCRYGKGGVAMVSALLSLKCSVLEGNRKEGDRKGWLPIHYCAKSGNRDLAKALADNDASCLDKRNGGGQLPADIATSESFKIFLSNL